MAALRRLHSSPPLLPFSLIPANVFFRSEYHKLRYNTPRSGQDVAPTLPEEQNPWPEAAKFVTEDCRERKNSSEHVIFVDVICGNKSVIFRHIPRLTFALVWRCLYCSWNVQGSSFSLLLGYGRDATARGEWMGGLMGFYFQFQPGKP